MAKKYQTQCHSFMKIPVRGLYGWHLPYPLYYPDRLHRDVGSCIILQKMAAVFKQNWLMIEYWQSLVAVANPRWEMGLYGRVFDIEKR